MPDITIVAAFIAGILSFLSPCVLPLVPGFIAYLAGTSIKNPSRMKTFLNSVFYVLGFAVVYSLLGVLLKTIFASFSDAIISWLARIGGVVIITFGLYLTGLLSLPFLERDYHLQVKKLRFSYVTSFLFGAAFAIGWSACASFILGSIIILAAVNPAQSFFLLFAYSLGLGIPFLLVGIFTAEAQRLISKSSVFLKYFNLVVGIILILLGILVFTQSLSSLISLAPVGFK